MEGEGEIAKKRTRLETRTKRTEQPRQPGSAPYNQEDVGRESIPWALATHPCRVAFSHTHTHTDGLTDRPIALSALLKNSLKARERRQTQID